MFFEFIKYSKFNGCIYREILYLNPDKTEDEVEKVYKDWAQGCSGSFYFIALGEEGDTLSLIPNRGLT